MKTANIFVIVLILISFLIDFSNAKKLLRKKPKINNNKLYKRLNKQANKDNSSIIDKGIIDSEEEEDGENDIHFNLSEADIMADDKEGDEDNQDFDDFTKNYKKYKLYGDMVVTTY